MARYESKDTWFEHNGENAKKPLKFVYTVRVYGDPDPRDTLIKGLVELHHQMDGVPATAGSAQVYHYRVGQILLAYDPENPRVRWAR